MHVFGYGTDLKLLYGNSVGGGSGENVEMTFVLVSHTYPFCSNVDLEFVGGGFFICMCAKFESHTHFNILTCFLATRTHACIFHLRAKGVVCDVFMLCSELSSTAVNPPFLSTVSFVT